MSKCPICIGETEETNSESQEGLTKIACSCCGNFLIDDSVKEQLVKDPDYRKIKYKLAGVIRKATEEGREIIITSSNLDSLIDSAPIPSGPIDSMDRTLLYVEQKSNTPGSPVSLMNKDYPIVYAKNPTEFVFYLQNLVSMEYLGRSSGGGYYLTVKGWKRVAELQAKGVKSDQAFVAMCFNEELRVAWSDGFESALVSTGFKPIRIDLIEHNKKIDDQIIAEVRRSGLLIADFTGNRGGVYFEAGFAMGLGIPVIWTCREDYVSDLHFDTRQYNHITWKEPRELKEKLINRIEATIPNRPKTSTPVI